MIITSLVQGFAVPVGDSHVAAAGAWPVTLLEQSCTVTPTRYWNSTCAYGSAHTCHDNVSTPQHPSSTQELHTKRRSRVTQR